MRRNGKRDVNENDIVVELRLAGHLVQPLMQGSGVPDLLVCTKTIKRLLVIEVKRDDKAELTPDQTAWHAQWAGAPVFIVTSAEQALALVAAADVDPLLTAVRVLREALVQGYALTLTDREKALATADALATFDPQEMYR